MFRRTTATLAITALVALTTTASPAGAQATEIDPYGAGANATALQITLGGLLGAPTNITVAGTSAAVDSEPTGRASADGVALATPLFSTPGAPVESTGAAVTGEDCIPITLPAPINLLDIGITCVNTSAEGGTSPTASSTAEEIRLDLISAQLVGETVDSLVRPLLDQVLAALDPLLTPLLGPGALDQLLNPLLDTVVAGDVLATISIAPTSSEASKSDSGVVAEATSGAARIEVLPALGPLVTVSVAETGAKVVHDPATGDPVVTTNFDVVAIEPGGLSSLLTNVLGGTGGALGGLLGPLLEPILTQVLDLLAGLDESVESLVGSLGLGVLACDGPLADIVCLSVGGINPLDADELEARNLDFGPETAGVEVTTLGLNLLNGTVVVALGQSTAAAHAELARLPVRSAPPAAPEVAAPPTKLPKTGGDATLPLTMALFAAAAGSVLLVRRSRTV